MVRCIHGLRREPRDRGKSRVKGQNQESNGENYAQKAVSYKTKKKINLMHLWTKWL